MAVLEPCSDLLAAMHNLDLILTLTGGLAAALVLGYITHRLGLSPIVGYLLAGIAVGPHTPGFVADQSLAEQFAEVGVILLMFGVGLQFHLKELLSVRRIAIPGAVGQSLVATLLGALAGAAFGWDWSAGIVLGLAISVASTVVLMRVLADNHDLHTPAGHIAVGWLVVEDLFTVIVLVLLPVLFAPNADAGAIGLAVAVVLFKVAVLVAFTFVVGGRVLPWLLAKVAMTRSRELFTLTVLVLALGIAVGSAKIFGVSMALGAFLAGMVVARSEFSFRAASEALPMRDAFAVLFFVSVGMLLDPAKLLESPGLIAATLAIILIGKPLSALAIVVLLRQPLGTALSVAVALAQIGEFSFILASLGRELGILSAVATNTLVAAAIVSISINPLLYRGLAPLERWFKRAENLPPWLAAMVDPQAVRAANLAATIDGGDRSERDERPSRHRAVVVGYGPVGRTVTRLLRENDVEPTVIDLNINVVKSLKQRGISAVYGDVAKRETLVGAGVARAGSLILSASNIAASAEVIRLARQLNPDIRVLARSAYVAELPALRQAGADRTYSGEGEVALAFTVDVLRDLGATADQIDRQRERVQQELFGKAAPRDLAPVEVPLPEAKPAEPAPEVDSAPPPG